MESNAAKKLRKLEEEFRNFWFGTIGAIAGVLVYVLVSYVYQSYLFRHGNQYREILMLMPRFDFVHYLYWFRYWGRLFPSLTVGVVGYLFGLFVSGIVSGLKESKSKPSVRPRE
jgi:hypothetical protein